MPRQVIHSAPDLDVGVDYNNNGRVNGLYVSNRSARIFSAGAVLTDGRVFGRDYPPGEHLENFPANLVTITRTVEPGSGDTLWSLTGVRSVYLGA